MFKDRCTYLPSCAAATSVVRDLCVTLKKGKAPLFFKAFALSFLYTENETKNRGMAQLEEMNDIRQ